MTVFITSTTPNTINDMTDGYDLPDNVSVFVEAGATVAGGTNYTGSTKVAGLAGTGMDATIDGTVWGEYYGIYAYQSATINVGATGTVTGAVGDGIQVASGTNVTIDNYGEIIGNLAQGQGTNTITAGINFSSLNGEENQVYNSGTISGENGIYFANGGNGVHNTGTISGNVAINIAAGTDSINNTGTLNGGTGIYIGGGTNNITNHGTIEGDQYGIHIGTDDAYTTIDNTGTIDGGSEGGVALTVTGDDGNTGTVDIINSGHISGNIYLGPGSDSYDGSLGSISGTITAGDGDDTLIGGAGSDTFDGGSGSNVLDGMGGNDTITFESATDRVDGGDGNDTIYDNGVAFAATSRIDGGAGNDTVQLDGGETVVLDADTLVNVETLSLFSEDHFERSYNLTMNDGNVAAGATLTVDASDLLSTDTLTFDASAETDGRYVVIGGAGVDTIKTGAGNDVINGGAGADKIYAGTGIDTMSGGAGNDLISGTGGFITAADKIDGGTGTDEVYLTGSYTGTHALVMTATTMVNVETLKVGGGYSYSVTTNDATVASGKTLKVDASALTGGYKLTFNGSAETNGHFVITGGNGGDVLTGGSQSDTFNYTSASQSTTTRYDTINAFNFTNDKFNVAGTIGAIDTAVSHTVSTASFDTDIAASSATLAANSAMLITANAGSLKGDVFLVIDQNGTAGYQTGHDLVIELHGATGSIGTADFI